MTETNAERLERLKDINDTKYIVALNNPTDDGCSPDAINFEREVDWLIEQAEQAQKFEGLYDGQLEVSQTTYDYFKYEIKKLREKNAQLVKDYNELFIQENAMQAHYQLAFSSMQMFKKCCDDITAAMNTERLADEKTKDVRRILEGLK